MSQDRAHPAADRPRDDDPPRRVIVAGFGPVGRSVTEQLTAAGVATTIVDLNPHAAAVQHRLRREIVLGDVTDPAVLTDAGIQSAAALILAIPDERAAVRACRVARKLNPDLFIAARTNFVSQGLLASEAGADHVTVEEIVTAEAMKQAVVHALLGEGGEEVVRGS
ncbi:MAG: NAD-binding protein [Phycisphaeraceae bacterium]